LQKIDKHSRVLNFAAFVFDQSISDVFCPLLLGGSVAMPSEEQRMNDITSFIRQAGVTWAHFTPSVARLLNPEAVPDLRVLVSEPTIQAMRGGNRHA
jgi:fusarinine C synthase